MNLWQVWQRTAARVLNKIVVIDGETGGEWTSHQLTQAAERLDPSPVIREPNGFDWLAHFLAIQRAGRAAIPTDAPVPPLKPPRGTCCVKLTSGSTGQAKPVYCSARHLLNDGTRVARAMGIRANDRNLAVIPLGHSYGLGNLVMPLIQQATPIVCVRSSLPRHLLDVIRKHRVTVFPAVPALLRALAQTAATKPPTLRLVISAGAPLSPEVAQQFYERFGLKVHNFYGASETGGIAYDRTGSGRGVGKPMQPVRIRRDGRIVVGKFVLSDLGEWNRDGELQLTGRAGEVANIGGKKVSPAEVEAALRTISGVTDAWVTVLHDRRDHLAAAVETTRAQPEIETELAHRLAAWKLPKRYFVAPSLPRTSRGKLDMAQLKATFP